VRKLVWGLVPIALAAGAVGGFLARAERTKTVTVVQIETQAPPPPATHSLTAIIQGANGACLPSTKLLTTDTFLLRRPSNGLTEGDVVGVASSSAMDGGRCYLVVNFSTSVNLGFFVVNDFTTSSTWGPFDSRQVAQGGWTMRLRVAP
jgi:hypothetical protein